MGITDAIQFNESLKSKLIWIYLFTFLLKLLPLKSFNKTNKKVFKPFPLNLYILYTCTTLMAQYLVAPVTGVTVSTPNCRVSVSEVARPRSRYRCWP